MAGGTRTSLDGFTERARLRIDINRQPYHRRRVADTRPRPIPDFSGSDFWVPVQHAVEGITVGMPTTSGGGEITYDRFRRELQVMSHFRGRLEDPAADQLYAGTSLIANQANNQFLRTFSPRKTRGQVQIALVALAVVMVAAGSFASLDAWKTNRYAFEQAQKLTRQANQAAVLGNASEARGTSQVPSTVKPSQSAVSSYAVAPNLPKFLRIPALGINARVTQVGILANGALGTPSNVYDTAWYSGSALPGQPGATLIDGHVSSWTTRGVFYNLHALTAGDAIQIIKGDNSVVNYTVVKSQVYASNDVNMQAAVTPIMPGVSGLNLITCTGRVIKGTSQFNQRVIVFARED